MRKKFIRSILAIGIVAATVTSTEAQRIQRKDYVEPSGWALGINFGMTDLWADIGTKKIMDHYSNGSYLDRPCFMGGLFGRYTIHPALCLRLGLNYGTLYATDKWNEGNARKATYISDDYYQRYVRNLEVRTNMWEANLMFEFNPRRLNIGPRTARGRFNPYLLAGFGYFHFNPQGILPSRGGTQQPKWVNLKDLHLEGDGWGAGYPEEINYWQMEVPLGIGVRWSLGEKLDLGLEYIYHYCFTDYLDNVSTNYVDPNQFDTHLDPDKAQVAREMYDKSWQITNYANRSVGDVRGNKSVNDAYSVINITFFYKVKSRRTPWWWYDDENR
ncbi:MAG: hypothetical protein BGO69_13825 [Bacteroidetes bacterium 46-16]|nr:MAG: hypothetical protein BGO69_13825 [Bacteroidetes bacterium 46-16]